MQKKKLIEVALPLDAINHFAGEEKEIHVGLPGNLHTWWSRKPLGVARAALFASVVDDPGNDTGRRDELFQLIEQLSDPRKIHDKDLLHKVRDELRTALGDDWPVFWDPYAGGGSLPLEAARLGFESVASDINPVSVLLNKVLCELAPRHAYTEPIHPRSQRELLGSAPYSGLKLDVTSFADDILHEVQSSIGSRFPDCELPPEYGGGKVQPVAWIWARAVRCSNPGCEMTSPLVSKFWLSTHTNNPAWVEPVVSAANGQVRFRVKVDPAGPPSGTVTRAGATCIGCGQPIPFSHIRDEGQAGRLTQKLMAIVVESGRGRVYLAPTETHEDIALGCEPPWVPETHLPERALGFRVQKYGIVKHSQLFSSRQLLALDAFSAAISKQAASIRAAADDDAGYSELIVTLLAIGLSRLAQANNTLVRWRTRTSGTSKGEPPLDRQIVSMVWEFSEGNIFGTSVGSWRAAIRNLLTALNALPVGVKGRALRFDCTSEAPLPVKAAIISTDPPYFDNIGYAHLSDFFYIWLRQTLANLYPDLFHTVLTPKDGDLTASLGAGAKDAGRARKRFLEGLKTSFRHILQVAWDDVPVTIYYAFKQTERSDKNSSLGADSTAWETLLESIIGADLVITGTWPFRTESANRIRALGSNALASSIVLACRKRSPDAPSVTRGEFLRQLRAELPEALQSLQQSAIAPVDMAQASIGPGMAVFSRYKEVLEADDSCMSVGEALRIINAELDAYLAEQEGDYDSWTRFAVTWFQQHGFDTEKYGEAEVLANARNVSVKGVVDAGILSSKANQVRILRRDELPEDYLPFMDNRQTVWEGCQHLIKRLQDGGEEAAARLAKQLGYQADMARDLAYRLYQICERNKWAEEARAYNGLIESWREIIKIRDGLPDETTPGPAQAELAV